MTDVLVKLINRHFSHSPSVYSERSLQRVALMASRAERGECSALYDGVVGARRAGALQAKRVAKGNVL